MLFCYDFFNFFLLQGHLEIALKWMHVEFSHTNLNFNRSTS